MEQLREVHSDYIPDGYINTDIDDIITELKGIWKYAALDLHVANDCKKTPEEYIVILIRMWDMLDKIPIQKVESTIVELEGMIMSDGDPCHKAIRTNLEQYLAVRMEQDISQEWDEQTEKYPKLFEAFAKEDPSILSDKP